MINLQFYVYTYILLFVNASILMRIGAVTTGTHIHAEMPEWLGIYFRHVKMFCTHQPIWNCFPMFHKRTASIIRE